MYEEQKTENKAMLCEEKYCEYVELVNLLNTGSSSTSKILKLLPKGLVFYIYENQAYNLFKYTTGDLKPCQVYILTEDVYCPGDTVEKHLVKAVRFGEIWPESFTLDIDDELVTFEKGSEEYKGIKTLLSNCGFFIREHI